MTAKKSLHDKRGDKTGEDEKKENVSENQPRQPVVTQVVEVVDDSGTEGQDQSRQSPIEKTHEEISQKAEMKLAPDIRAIEPLGTVVVPPVQEPPKEQEAQPEVEVPQEQKIEEKEVITELFQKDTSVGYPEISEHKRSPIKGLMLWAVIVVVVAIAIGTVLLFFAQRPVTVSTVTANPSPILPQGPTVTPTQVAELKKSDLAIQVLNGGGVRGAASKMKSVLEGKGYTVEDTGNTNEYTHMQTEIYVKAGKEGYLALLEEDLRGEYKIGTKEATLSADVSYDARIIVGKE